jgi:hypothetical protein
MLKLMLKETKAKRREREISQINKSNLAPRSFFI